MASRTSNCRLGPVWRSMRAAVAAAVVSGHCTAGMPPGPQAVPQGPSAVSNRVCPVALIRYHFNS